ncbi:MAG TPA: choice-of-anchor tandem repeat GloVer-containing protein, partial [Terriglobia bacterium]
MSIATKKAAGGHTLALVLVCALGFAATPLARGQSYTERVLHLFTDKADGGFPQAGLVRDAAGNLYGTTYEGGAVGYGTVFEVSAGGTESVLYTFTGGADGGRPFAGLVRDAAGNLYGTAQSGGDLNCNAPYGCGTVFELSASGAERVL